MEADSIQWDDYCYGGGRSSWRCYRARSQFWQHSPHCNFASPSPLLNLSAGFGCKVFHFDLLQGLVSGLAMMRFIGSWNGGRNLQSSEKCSFNVIPRRYRSCYQKLMEVARLSWDGVVVLYMMWKLICSHGLWWIIPLPRSSTFCTMEVSMGRREHLYFFSETSVPPDVSAKRSNSSLHQLKVIALMWFEDFWKVGLIPMGTLTLRGYVIFVFRSSVNWTTVPKVWRSFLLL